MRRRERVRVRDHERNLDYLLAEEREERTERRGLEQRAAGLLAALLVSLPVVATVAKDADLDVSGDLIGLILLGLALLLTIGQASSVTRALSAAAPRSGTSVKHARHQVRRHMGRGDLAQAVNWQGVIVNMLREDNVRLVTRVRVATRRLPVLLATLLVGLALVIRARSDGSPEGAAPASVGVTGPRG